MAASPKNNRVEQAFEEALARLLVGKPNHPTLAEKAEKGTLRISLNTVALEAGQSRTLISQKDSPYQHIRERILALNSDKKEKKSLNSVIEGLRQENALLRRQVTMALSESVAILNRMHQLEQHLNAAQQRVKLLTNNRDTPNLIIQQPNLSVGIGSDNDFESP